VLPSLFNVVTDLANGRLLAVGSYGRARGLQQKAALPSWRQGWLQARWVRERVGKI